MSKSFQEILEKDENTVLVVDALNLCFRWKHSGAEYFSEEFYDTVMSLANSYDCSRIIITADQGSSSYRKALLPEYKGNRQELRDKQTEEEAEAFLRFFEEYTSALEFMKAQGLLVLQYDKIEADDIAAYVTKILPDHKIWLISTDHDWDLLINENVSRWAYTTRNEFRLDNWYDAKDHLVSPELFISYKCLVGDKGDNIPGITQVGPKRAAALIEDYGDVFDIYDACPLPGKYKYIQNLNAEFEVLPLNVELMDLLAFCEDALGATVCKDIDTRMVEYLK